MVKRSTLFAFAATVLLSLILLAIVKTVSDSADRRAVAADRQITAFRKESRRLNDSLLKARADLAATRTALALVNDHLVALGEQPVTPPETASSAPSAPRSSAPPATTSPPATSPPPTSPPAPTTQPPCQVKVLNVCI